jgi:hypothetical protein
MIEVQKPTAEQEARAPEAGAASVVPADIPALELQLTPALAPARVYQLDELLRYHDRAFVEQLYVALLRRTPTDAERAHTLADLRGGRHTKIEIIEELLAGAAGPAQARVMGLPSPLMRRVGRWPLIGYVLRLLRGLMRLPVLMQHQQQFEAYALGQQQRIAEHINGVLAPALVDALDGVLMLSDSLQAHIIALEAALRVQQQRQDAGFTAQQEFLVQEQHVIVETQKVALEELRADLRALAATHEQQHAELLAQVRRLQTLVESAQARTSEQA